MDEDDEELEDEWRERITKHLPPHVAPDDWVVKAFKSGTVIAVAMTLEDENADESDEPITVAALAKIEARGVETETAWFFAGCREWTSDNADESLDAAAAYLAGEIAKAAK